jgi:hypothetical protein
MGCKVDQPTDRDIHDVIETMALATAYCEKAVELYDGMLQITLTDFFMTSIKKGLRKHLRDRLKLNTADAKILLQLVHDPESLKKQGSLIARARSLKEARNAIKKYISRARRGSSSSGDESGFEVVSSSDNDNGTRHLVTTSRHH